VRPAESHMGALVDSETFEFGMRVTPRAGSLQGDNPCEVVVLANVCALRPVIWHYLSSRLHPDEKNSKHRS
jgi:hypothetical protein